MTAALGFSRGFSKYRESWPPFAEKIDRLIDDMARWGDTPRFVFLHTFETHAPYTHPEYASYLEDHELRRIRAAATYTQAPLRDTLAGLKRIDVGMASDLYDGGIRYVGEHIGRLLDFVRRDSSESWDVNGDGSSDVPTRGFGEDRFGCEWPLFGGSLFHAQPCNRAPNVVVFDADFDGDGRPDVLVVDQIALESRVRLGSSGEPADEQVWLRGLGRGVTTRIGGFDEDARDDVRIESRNGCLLLGSTGSHFEPNSEACSG